MGEQATITQELVDLFECLGEFDSPVDLLMGDASLASALWCELLVGLHVELEFCCFFGRGQV